MILWHASELHTHTRHSDGQYTVRELLEQSVQAGYDTVALTDHNTISGLAELVEEAQQVDIRVIRGIEWSSFYGHMVTHGARYYIPWQDIGLGDIHTGIAKVHEAGGIAGIAHPFTIGEPFCLGCHWHFKVFDWSHPDYIEVWNERWPSLEHSNIKAYQFWTSLLDKGVRISAASGRDWHGEDHDHECFPVTFVGVEDDLLDQYEAGWLAGMKLGRISVSFGPLLLIQMSDSSDGHVYQIGDQADRRRLCATADIHISLDFDRRRKVYALDARPLQLSLVSNLGTLWQGDVLPDQHSGAYQVSPSIATQGLVWLRCEAHGYMRGRLQTVAFTNPIYFR